MSRKDDILSRIHKLEEKIERYRGYIEELREEYKLILKRYNHLQKEAYEPARAYDMTGSDRWLGECLDAARALQEKIVIRTGKGQSETNELLSDIERIIARLEKLIQDCEDEIAELKAELESLSDDDDEGAGYEGKGK